MKYFLSVVCFAMVHLSMAQQSKFDFDQAWEEVYKAELLYLPKSAKAKVDSIYEAATRLNRPRQHLKSLIYQSKYFLISEEESYKKLVARYKSGIATLEAPYRNILQNQLAKLIEDIYQKSRWQIRQRSKMASPEGEIDTWDKSRFFEEARTLYMASLELPDDFKLAPLSEYQDLVKPVDDSRKFRPLLIDLLAHNALTFFKNNERERVKPKEPFVMADRNLLAMPEQFITVPISHADSNSYYMTALKIYQELTRTHLSEEASWALTDLTVERLSFVRINGFVPNDDVQYRSALIDLLAKLEADSSAVIPYLALARFEYNLGEKYNPRANQAYQFKKVEALAICDSIIGRFPKSDFTENAGLLREAIVQPMLRLNAEKFVLPRQPSKLLATYKNNDQVFFQTYRIKPSQYDSFNTHSTDSARLADLKNFDKARQWQASLQNEGDYQEHSQEVLFPEHGLGAYLVMAFADEARTQPLAFQMVQVTHLAMVQLYNPYLQNYQVINRQTGVPVPGVNVHLYTRESNKRSARSRHYTTDENGMISFSSTTWNSYVYINLTHGSDSVRVRGQYLGGERKPSSLDSTEYNIEAQLFLDRAIYRPGQQMHFKAILFKQTREGSSVLSGKGVTITLFDPNDEDIWTEDLTTNEFGSVSGKLDLPKTGLTGQYYLKLEAENRFEKPFYYAENDLEIRHPFRVEEYKRPKFEINFDDITAAYRYNDSVFVKGWATALAGSQLSNASVSYKVNRSTQEQRYGNYGASRYNSTPTQVAHGELKTDEQGNFTIPFKALVDPDKINDPDIKIRYAVSVTVTDINGETRSAEMSVSMAKNPYMVVLRAREQYEKGPDSLNMPVYIHSLNGARQTMGGEVTIERLQAPAFVKRPAPWKQPDYQSFTKQQHDQLFPHWPYENEEAPDQWLTLHTMLTQELKPGETELFKIGDFQNWPSGYYKATYHHQTDLGDTLQAEKVFLLKSPNAQKLPDQALFEVSLDKARYEVGDTAVVTFGTAAGEMGVHFTIHREFSLDHQSSVLKNETKQLRIPIRKGDEAGIKLYYYHVAFNSFQSGQLKIDVRKRWPKLVLETGTFRDKLQPGSPEQWSFKVKGEEGEATSAELLASMYDASLDQFASNQWGINPYYNFENYSYGRVDALGTFNTAYFSNLITMSFYRPLNRLYEQWNWFGLDIRNPEFSQSNYVNNLRFRRNARPVVTSEKRDLPAGIIEGIVFDEMGNPFQYVNVTIKDTMKGDATNEKGKFQLAAKLGQQLYISFIGYKTFQLPISENNYYEIQLLPDFSDVGEVMVVGYNSVEKKEISSSIVMLEVPDDEEVAEEVIDLAFDNDFDLLRGDAAGLEIWNDKGVQGFFSMKAANKPLMIIDGVPMTAQASFDSMDVGSVQMLESAQAMTLYGDKAVNGVLIITTKKEEARQNALVAQVKARTNLKETAFFFPQLKTNEKGEVSFEFESPESLTRWKLQLLAHRKDMASAILRRSVVTQKELMLLPNAPRFVREGDQLTFSAKIASLSTDTLRGFARLELFDAVTEQAVQSVVKSPTANPNFSIMPNGNTEVNWQLEIPEGLQALRYRIVAVAGDFSDGEENVLPVLSNRMLVKEALPLWVNAKTSKSFSLDKLSSQQSKTLKHNRLSLHLTTNPVWEAIRSLPYLMEYPYECAEQTFARYYANSLGKYILEEQPVIKEVFERWKTSGALVSKLEQNEELKAMLIEETPWLREAKSETEQQKRLAALFETEKLAEGLNASLVKLRQMQFSSGGFPWFAGSSYENRYITQHIITGLLHLKSFTGTTEFDDIIEKGLGYMQRMLTEDYQRLLKRKKFNPELEHIGYRQIQFLYAYSLAEGKKPSPDFEKAFSFYKKQAYDFWPDKGLQSKAMIALFALAQGDKRVTKKVMRSLKEYSIENEELGIYWKNNVAGWRNSEAPIETQSLMIEAFSKIEGDEDFVNGLRKWLLNHKRTNSWSSTKATTTAVNALLSFGPDWTGPNNQVTVTAGSKTLLKPQQTESGSEAGTGYMKKIWQADEVEPQLATVVIENTGKTQVWGGLHWQYFEDLDKITPAMGPLSVEKSLYLVKQTATGEQLQAISTDSPIKVGDLVRVRIVLKTDRVMEFIHLKDMRASGFEPVKVLSEYHWQDGLGYYESTRDAATNFFIEYMPTGTYVFEYDLRANNAGSFSNGITSIQNMYAPEFSSHTAGIQIEIGK